MLNALKSYDLYDREIARIPRENVSSNLYTITSFDEFLKDKTYLFLRTHDAEGHYAFDKSKTAFANIVQATAEFLGRTLTDQRMESLKHYWKDHFSPETLVAPVHSYNYEGAVGNDFVFRLTDSGSNLMSILSCIVFFKKAGINIDFGFQQKDKFTRNASGEIHRLSFPVRFSGKVEGGSYVVFDDHIKSGSTVANLAGHINEAGAQVKGFMALSVNPILKSFKLTDATWQTLLTHPYFINTNEFWKNNFGYSLDCLTDPEANMLLELLDSHKENLPARLRDYQRNPDSPFYPKPEWWQEKINEPQVCSLSDLGVDARLIVLPQA